MENEELLLLMKKIEKEKEELNLMDSTMPAVPTLPQMKSVESDNKAELKEKNEEKVILTLMAQSSVTLIVYL